MSKDIDIKQLPAFPVNMSGPCTFAGIDIPEGVKVEWGGMTLRDYFAAKAMQGFCADPSNHELFDNYHHVAKAAYAMSYAMLEARK